MTPHLASAVADPDAVRRLGAAAAELPPSVAAGVEVRLDDDTTIDLQQAFRGDQGGAAALAAIAANRDGGAWRRLERVAAAWADPAHCVHDAILEVWLEWDLDETGAAGDSPSVFATLRHEASDRVRAAVLDLLLDGAEPVVRETFERAVAVARPRGGVVSHLGVMLGRPLQAARLHVSHLPLADWPEALTAVGWPGDGVAACDEAEALLMFADRAVLCLDIAAAVGPRLGIEAHLRRRAGSEIRWWRQFETLAARGLCREDKAVAIPAWPGADAPGVGDWPASMIARDLVRPESEFGWIERRMSHVKVTLDGEGRAAKAYFGWGHVHRTTDGSEPPEAPVPRLPAPTVETAIDRAAAFVLASRRQDGLWGDFLSTEQQRGMVLHECDEWVTGYVGAALVRVPSDDCREAARTAWEVLTRRPSREGGFAYNRMWPPDSDSTGWVLRIAEALGIGGEAVERAEAFVRTAVVPGGVGTFPESTWQALSGLLVREPSFFRYWGAPHLCVTAAAVPTVGDEAVDSLVASQQADGRWASYWWTDDCYATGMACWTLSSVPGEPARRAVARGARWLTSRVDDDGGVRDAESGEASAFDAGLALMGLAAAVRAGHDEVVAARDRLVRWLLDAQRADGSFEPSAVVVIPDSSVEPPVPAEDIAARYLDTAGLFTAATVLWALLILECRA